MIDAALAGARNGGALKLAWLLLRRAHLGRVNKGQRR